MENVEELRREAEEVKERLRKDILDLRDILKKAADGMGETSQAEAEAAVRRAEQRLEETVSHVEKRFEKAIGVMAGCIFHGQPVVTRKLDFSDFTSIDVECAYHVTIVPAAAYRVSVRAVPELIDFVDAAKSGNTLKLSLKPQRFETRPTVQAKIALPTLSKIRLGAATRGTVQRFDLKGNLDIRLSGSSTLDADIAAETMRCEISGASRLSGKMQVNDAEFTLSGASRVTAGGTARNVTLNAWGASRIEMADLLVNEMTIHLGGACEALINVAGNLDADLNSGSRLTYVNNPTIRKTSVAGASSLNHK